MKLALKVEKLHPKFGVKLSLANSEDISEANNSKNNDSKAFSSFTEILISERLVLLDETTEYLLDNMPIPNIFTSTERKKNTNDNPYYFWHTDKGINQFHSLKSLNCDYLNQTPTSFVRAEDMSKKLISYIPNLIKDIEKKYTVNKEMDSSLNKIDSRNFLEIIFNQTDTSENINNNNINKYMSLLRIISMHYSKSLENFTYENVINYAFNPVEVSSENSKFKIYNNRNLGIKFSLFLERFSNIPFVHEHVKEMFNVENKYEQIWQPNQTLIWDGNDTSLCHGRFKMPNQKLSLSLERRFGIHTLN